MLMTLMKFGFVPQSFFSFFPGSVSGSGFTIKLTPKSYAFYIKDTHQMLCGSAEFFSKSYPVKDQDIYDFTLDCYTRTTRKISMGTAARAFCYSSLTL